MVGSKPHTLNPYPQASRKRERLWLWSAEGAGGCSFMEVIGGPQQKKVY